MDSNEAAKQLFEVIGRFRKVNWHKPTIEGYKASELKMLFVIHRENKDQEHGVTVSDISRIMEVTSPTVTQLIRGLEDSGLVIRHNDQIDRRVVRITLTPEGRQVSQRVKDRWNEQFSELVQHLGEEQSKTLAHLLSEVFNYMESRESSSKEEI